MLYLGAPPDSVVAEAYRHIIDPLEDGAEFASLLMRLVIRCHVAVDGVVDLRDAATRDAVGLSAGDLASPVGAYQATQRVGQAAYAAGRTGVTATS